LESERPHILSSFLLLPLRSNTTARITSTAANKRGPTVQRAMDPLIELIIPLPIIPPIIEGIIHIPRTHKTRTTAATISTVATMLCALLFDISPPFFPKADINIADGGTHTDSVIAVARDGPSINIHFCLVITFFLPIPLGFSLLVLIKMRNTLHGFARRAAET